MFIVEADTENGWKVVVIISRRPRRGSAVWSQNDTEKCALRANVTSNESLNIKT